MLDRKLDEFYKMLNPVDDFYNKFDIKNYKNKYNNLYLKQDMIKEYIKGITWIVKYYFGQDIDETWYYKYGRSPLLSDVVNYFDYKFDINYIDVKKNNLIPLYQILFITPFNYNLDLNKQIKFIDYNDKNKITSFIKNNKNYYYDIDKIFNEILKGDNDEIDCSTSIFTSKCHLHFLENEIDINKYVQDIKDL